MTEDHMAKNSRGWVARDVSLVEWGTNLLPKTVIGGGTWSVVKLKKKLKKIIWTILFLRTVGNPKYGACTFALFPTMHSAIVYPITKHVLSKQMLGEPAPNASHSDTKTSARKSWSLYKCFSCYRLMFIFVKILIIQTMTFHIFFRQLVDTWWRCKPSAGYGLFLLFETGIPDGLAYCKIMIHWLAF